jgi:uncharacterized protein (TIGR04255 family)
LTLRARRTIIRTDLLNLAENIDKDREWEIGSAKMARFYENAPIVEAVIDLQVENENVSEENFNQFSESVKGRYDKRFPVNEAQFQINVPDGDVKQNFKNIGYRFVSNQSDRIIIAKEKGFTFSNLPKYRGWSKFSSEAKSHWEKFVKALKPSQVQRIAVRYINKINIPTSSGVELKDYFNIYPEISDDVSAAINGAYMQIKIPQPDLGKNYASVINLATAEPDEPGFVTIVLDIDVYALVNMEPTDEQIWQVLDKLRDKKNKLFEAAIKDSIRELIK